MLCCPSSACTKRADCKPNTLSAGGVGGAGRSTCTLTPVCMCAHPAALGWCHICVLRNIPSGSHVHKIAKLFWFWWRLLMPCLLYRLQPGPGPKLGTLYIFNDFAGVFFHAADTALCPILLSHPSVSLWVPLISIIRKTCAKIIINSRLCNYSRWGSFPLTICNGFIKPCVRRDR